MTILGKEHYELIAQFDSQFSYLRLDKEPKSFWPRGNIYQNGQTNDLFLAFRSGVAFGTAISR